MNPAFERNLGLISRREADILENSCVAIPGLGGVGGAHIEVLARQGIGRFKIADFDVFETANLNRQFGATQETLGRAKTDVLEQRIKSINKNAVVEVFPYGISEKNIDAFLEGVDVVVDSLDAFAIETRRMLLSNAYKKGIPVVAAGPIGFGAVMQVILPGEMTFDEFFGFRDEMPEQEKLLRFFMGLTPKALHVSYLDMAYVSLREKRGPSSSIGIAMCASLAAAEVLKILLKWEGVRGLPYYTQFDARKGVWVRKYLIGGAAWNPLAMIKRAIARRIYKDHFF
jgi:molybdopterin/thiamine biosynthesis adenylyltransferase